MEKMTARLCELLVSLLLIAFVNSCSSYYYVETYVDNDLSVIRSVYTESSDRGSSALGFVSDGLWEISDVDDAFPVDFYDEIKLMRIKSVADADDIASLRYHPDSENEYNPVFRPVETLSKRFRWFYTYYEYKAVFASIKDELPLPFDSYMTDEQLELFFKGDNPPAGWNGIEMYCLLDDVNQNFARWYSDGAYQVLCEVLEPYCDDFQFDMLVDSKERFMKTVQPEALFGMDPYEFTAKLEEVFPHAGFSGILKDNSTLIEDDYEKKTGILEYFLYSFMYSLRLPGEYIDGNAVDFMDGCPIWKADAFRLMYDDLVMEAVSRKLNLWAFFITFISIAVLLQVFAKIFSVR